MKKVWLLFLPFFISLTLQGQDFELVCGAISQIDQEIYRIDNGIQKSSKFKRGYKEFDEISDIVENRLIPRIGFLKNTQATIKARLDCIVHTETITWLEFVYNSQIKELEDNFRKEGAAQVIYPNENATPSCMKVNLELIHQRMEEIMDAEFSLYRYTDISKKWIRAVYVDHQNDVFFLNNYNDDRDLTGSFRIEVATDLFKLRLFSSRLEKWFNINSRNWYSYQSIFIGGEGYTPFLRDTTIFKEPTSIDPNDRPFASFTYFGWAKYRISRLGKFRVNTQLKIGSIGDLAPDNVQSIIHRDLVIGSVDPNGWEAQVAAGGRLGFSFEIMNEMCLNKNRKENAKGWLSKLPYISVLGEGKIGHDMTALAVGFNLSYSDFKERGGWNVSFLNKKNFYPVINYRGYLRYVFHNSMLEGYGIFKQTPDEDPSSPVDLHVLTRGRNGTPDQINEWVFVNEFSVNLSFKYINIILKQAIWSPEYDLPINTYETAEFGKHNTSKWNHVGTIGIVFKI